MCDILIKNGIVVTMDPGRRMLMDGSVAIEKDRILVDIRKPHLCPLNMPVDRVTYFANGGDVDTVIVDGENLMEDRDIKTVDEAAILEMAQGEIEAAVGRSGMKTFFDTTDRYRGHSRY